MQKEKPTEDQIKAEINRLFGMKPRVVRQSMFADDHHAAIDAQVEVLQDAVSDDPELFDEGAIDDRAEIEGWAENVRLAAVEAYQWLEGEEKSSPSNEWRCLVR